jgi:hypothetical protein
MNPCANRSLDTICIGVICESNNRGLGLSPDSTPHQWLYTLNINTYSLVYITRNKRWSAGRRLVAKALSVGEVRGSNPVDSQCNFIYEKNDQRMSDTWRPRVGPRFLILFANNGHVSAPHSPLSTQSHVTSNTSSDCTALPRHRTDCTDRYSQHQTFFCLFGLTNRSRYLLHTDSV